MGTHKIRSFFLVMLFVACTGCAFVSLDLGSITQLQPFEERVISKGTKDRILVVEVLGMIRTTNRHDSFMPKQGTFERVENVLDIAKDDKRIKGIILKIDSPGGGYTASDLIFRKIQDFKSSQKVPVVACITDQGTSGAYMIALSSDYIVALPSSVVGNVGVLMPSISLGGLMEKLGIAEQTVKSGKLKDAGSPLHDMSGEEKTLLKSIVMEFYDKFIERVKSRRPVTKEDITVIQDGRVMTADMGKKLHLIDEVGYYEDSLKKISTLANVENPTVVVYRRRGENKGGFYTWP
jgi:protease IV